MTLPGIHAADQHVAVVTVAGNDRILVAERVLDADGNRLLADIEMAEAADQTHAVELAGLLLEAPDQQHLTVERQPLLVAGCAAGAGFAAGR